MSCEKCKKQGLRYFHPHTFYTYLCTQCCKGEVWEMAWPSFNYEQWYFSPGSRLLCGSWDYESYRREFFDLINNTEEGQIIKFEIKDNFFHTQVKWMVEKDPSCTIFQDYFKAIDLLKAKGFLKTDI
jgi:hypothetical protein